MLQARMALKGALVPIVGTAFAAEGEPQVSLSWSLIPIGVV